MKQRRPINLNLFTIHFPLPAIVSILHRISGVILFLLIPFILWGLDLSLASQQDFDSVHQFFLQPLTKILIWCILAAFIYHFVAGIRHLFMDMGVGENLKSGRMGAVFVLLISIILIILAGVWLW